MRAPISALYCFTWNTQPSAAHSSSNKIRTYFPPPHVGRGRGSVCGALIYHLNIFYFWMLHNALHVPYTFVPSSILFPCAGNAFELKALLILNNLFCGVFFKRPLAVLRTYFKSVRYGVYAVAWSMLCNATCCFEYSCLSMSQVFDQEGIPAGSRKINDTCPHKALFLTVSSSIRSFYLGKSSIVSFLHARLRLARKTNIKNKTKATEFWYCVARSCCCCFFTNQNKC